MPDLGRNSALLTAAALGLAAGCAAVPSAPPHPTWVDVAPILRGECGGCHGWTAQDLPPNAVGVRPENTGGSLRFDFYDVTADVCGAAALAVDPGVSFAGSPVATVQMETDVVPQNGARWPRMPPQPSPALPGWQIETLERWAANPVKGPAPPGNRPPTITVSDMPSAVDAQLAFTAIIDDPDGDSALGVIEVGGTAFLMDRPGSFNVQLDSSAWAPGQVHPTAVLCDGWAMSTTDLGPVEVQR